MKINNNSIFSIASMTKRSFVILAILIPLYAVPTTLTAATMQMPSNEGLVAYWSFDEGHTNKSRDLTGRGSNGTLMNMGNPATPTSGWTNNGKINGGIAFDGLNDYVDLGDTLNLSLPITFSFWMNASDMSEYRSIIATDKTTIGNLSGAWMAVEPTGKVSISYGSNVGCSSSGIRTKVSPNVVTTNQWYQVTGVIRGATDMDIYINGVDVGGTYSGTGAGIVHTSASARIGSAAPCVFFDNQSFEGYLDDVRVYNRALSASEAALFANKLPTAHTATNDANTPAISGLVAHWTLDQGALSQAKDNSGNNVHATLTNMADPATTASGWTTNGKINGGVAFDGINDYIDVGSPASLNLTQDLTLSAWIRPLSAQKSCTVANTAPIFGRPTNSRAPYALDVSTSFIRFQQNSSDNVWQSSVVSTPVPFDGTWTHIAVTRNASVISFYKNGTLVATTTNQASSLVSYPGLRLGYDGCSARYFDGTMDDVRMYNRDLSASEIASLGTKLPAKIATSYTAGVSTTATTGINGGLVGYWTFDGSKLTATTAMDSSPSGFNGTLVNGPVAAIGRIGQALQFDGSNDRVDTALPSNATNPPMTWSVWIKPTEIHESDLGRYRVITRGNLPSSRGAISIDDGNIRLITNSGTMVGSYPAKLNAWQHIVAVWYPTTWELYVDGLLRASGSASISAASVVGYKLGVGLATGGDRFFKGSMDDVRIYNRALSASEVTQLYKMGGR